MIPTLGEIVAVLERTPRVLEAWLTGLPEAWTRADDGPGTWSAFEVVGHLLHGERTDWIPRARIILEHGDTRPFEPFDREAMRTTSRGRTLAALLGEFAAARRDSLATLRNLRLTPADLDRRGLHPELGSVTLGQLLATWATHDLSHLAQIARTMARRGTDAVGPWKAYLAVLTR